MKLVYLSGGVGGARLLEGLAAVLGDDATSLTAIVNVGDDFEHLGLKICPDIDSVLYALGGLGDEARGWGVADETFRALAMAARHEPDAAWFQLGDQDLGTHLVRTLWLSRGRSLSEVTAQLARGLGVRARVVPASDEASPTFIETERDGTLPFQEWLVQRRSTPAVAAIRMPSEAAASDAALAAVDQADLLVLGPSNPYVSIDPILALRGMREQIHARRARAPRCPVIAVSPIVAGHAVKGPLAEMVPSLARRAASAAAIAAHYGALLDAFVVEHADDAPVRDEHPALQVLATNTVMRSRQDRRALGQQVLALAERLRAAG